MRCHGRQPNERIAISEPFIWADSKEITFPLFFLEPKWARMARPVITFIKLIITTSNWTTGAGNSLRGAQLAQIISRFYARDRYGDRCDLTGAELLHVMRMERDFAFLGRDLAVNAAGQVRTFALELPVEMWGRGQKQSETRWDARDLRAGEVTIKCSVAAIGQGTNAATVNSATFRLIVGILDEGAGAVEHKMRVRYRHYKIGKSEDTYPLKGALRWAVLYTGSVGEALQAQATWASQQITSFALDLSAIDDFMLTDLDLERRQPRRTAPNLAADEEDGSVSGLLQSIFTPPKNVPTTELPLLDVLDVKTSLAFPSGVFTAANDPQVLVSYIEMRPEQCEGQPPAGAIVKTNDGAKMVTGIPRAYQRILPIVAAPGALDKS